MTEVVHKSGAKNNNSQKGKQDMIWNSYSENHKHIFRKPGGPNPLKSESGFFLNIQEPASTIVMISKGNARRVAKLPCVSQVELTNGNQSALIQKNDRSVSYLMLSPFS